MATKRKSSPSPPKSQPDKPKSKKSNKIKQQIVQEHLNDNQESQQEQKLEESCEDEPSKRETLKELLQPFSKDQIIEFLKFAISQDKELLPRITHFLESDPTHRKLFVHGLSWDTTSEQVLSTFAEFGEVENCNVPIDKVTKRSKGFAFVLYKTRSAAENALREKQKKIGNRMIYCQLASDGPVGANSSVDGNGRKIFVANVGSHVDPEMIKLFFEKFGDLEEGPLGMDFVSGKFRGYCFFVYKNSEGCKKALEEPVKMFDNCRLECRLAIDGFKKNQTQNQVPVLNNGYGGSTYSDVGSNMTYNVGVSPAFYGSSDLIGQNLGYGLANPMSVPSLNQNGLATAIGEYPQTIEFGGNYGISSVSPSVSANYASLQGLGGYQAQLGNSSAGSQSAGYRSTGQDFSSHIRL